MHTPHDPSDPGSLHDLHDLRGALDARMAGHRADLEALVRIPSVSADGFDPAEVRRSAEAVRALLVARGLEHVRLLEIEGAHPAVYGDWLHAGPDAPTVLCYAHHDVQPPGDLAAWASPPFEPTERDGRLYGRGAADDKAGILLHVAAVDAWLTARGRLPVNVKLIVEGEEEIGSTHLLRFLETYQDLLRSDVIVPADTVNWAVGIPGLTYMLRGLVDCTVTVRGLDHALHSGMYGGPLPDPLTGLVKLLATVTDEHGSIAIPGFTDDLRPLDDAERERFAALGYDEARLREESGLLDGVALGGDPSAGILERLWTRPNVTIIGLDAPAVATASNTITPSARARVSVRLAAGQDPQRALGLLCGWLAEQAPWGLHVEVVPGWSAGAWAADPSGPAHQAALRALEAAYGKPAVLVGVGGTIPFVQPFSDAFGGAPALLVGVEDPDSRAHGIDESLHLADWARGCLAQAYLFAELAAIPAGDLRPAVPAAVPHRRGAAQPPENGGA